MWGGRVLQGVIQPTKKLKQCTTSKFHYSVLNTPSVETVHVTCGSSGYVELNIHNNIKKATSKPIIIYLPSLWPRSSIEKPTVPRALLTHTVIQINPRWSSAHPFPPPIHDTLYAYHWILENLISPNHLSLARPIAVYGNGLGGTLATSLALTESRQAQRSSVKALAVQDAVFDWSVIATSPPPPAAIPGEEPDSDLLALYGLRGQLFREPASAFDAFASPTLFFRTTGLFIPATFPQVSPPPDPPPEAAFTSRKAHLTFPPRRSGLWIPYVRIGITRRGSVLEAQAREIVKLMQRSVVLHEGKRARRDYFDAKAEAERRIALVKVGNVHGKADHGGWAAEFFKEALG